MISDTVLVALITGLPPTLAAIGALIVTMRASKKTDENTRKTDANSKKIDESIVEVVAVREIAQRTSVEVKQMTTGAFQAAYLQGVAHERHKNSDLGTLE